MKHDTGIIVFTAPLPQGSHEATNGGTSVLREKSG